MKEIDAQSLQNLLDAGKPVNVIDIREPFELMTGKIPGAKNITLADIEAGNHKFNKEEEYVLVCRSGRRTAYATELLTDQGYDVTNMVGGMLDWQGEIE